VRIETELGRRIIQLERAAVELPNHAQHLTLEQLERIARALARLERWSLTEVNRRESYFAAADRPADRKRRPLTDD
jgi:hypothetical protein